MNEEMLTAALNYARFGLPVFPCQPDKKPIGGLCPHGFKDASRDEAQVKKWWSARPDANIGIPTGPASGVDLLDCDIYKPGVKDRLDRLIAELGPLPPTREVRSGSGGRHLWLQSTPGLRCAQNAFGEGIDVKGDGGYMIVPPSRTENGNTYTFTNRLPWVPWPESYIERLLKRQPDPAQLAATPSGNKITPGQRHHRLFSLAGTMRKRGASDAAILALLRAENEERCSPPLSDSEVVQLATGIKRYAPGESAAEEPSPEPETVPALPEAVWRGIFKQYREALRGKSEAPEAYHFASVWAACAAHTEAK
jgi:hypothetical protein